MSTSPSIEIESCSTSRYHATASAVWEGANIDRSRLPGITASSPNSESGRRRLEAETAKKCFWCAVGLCLPLPEAVLMRHSDYCRSPVPIAHVPLYRPSEVATLSPQSTPSPSTMSHVSMHSNHSYEPAYWTSEVASIDIAGTRMSVALALTMRTNGTRHSGDGSDF